MCAARRLLFPVAADILRGCVFVYVLGFPRAIRGSFFRELLPMVGLVDATPLVSSQDDLVGNLARLYLVHSVSMWFADESHLLRVCLCAFQLLLLRRAAARHPLLNLGVVGGAILAHFPAGAPLVGLLLLLRNDNGAESKAVLVLVCAALVAYFAVRELRAIWRSRS